jgi:hypothetical protein
VQSMFIHTQMYLSSAKASIGEESSIHEALP